MWVSLPDSIGLTVVPKLVLVQASAAMAALQATE